MSRPTVVIALPPDEQAQVAAELDAAGFDCLPVATTDQLEDVLRRRAEVVVAILDVETDEALALGLHDRLHADGRSVPALIVVSPAGLDRIATNPGIANAAADDEFVLRPYSAESLRWQVEAMRVRSQVVDDGSGPVIQTDVPDGVWARRAVLVGVFNPKGGVGKTTIATNVAAALQMRRDQRVLLIDADTVTGHVATSLGLDQGRTVADSWRDELDGGPLETLVDIAAEHPSGLRVVALSASPLATDVLEPDRVADAIVATRRGFDFVVVDLHGSYSPINRALFERADRILVPVTPDMPAIRAAVQMREVAAELGLRERLAMVVNRANSGVSVEDMERTIGIPIIATVRSGGLLFVRAVNEGRTVIEMFPREQISQDFADLADRLLGTPKSAPAPSRSPMRLFGRQKEAARV